MSERAVKDSLFPFNYYCYSDECSFFLARDGKLPQLPLLFWFQPTSFSRAAYSAPDQWILFLPFNLTSEMYSERLWNAIDSALTDEIQNNPQYGEDHVCFQQVLLWILRRLFFGFYTKVSQGIILGEEALLNGRPLDLLFFHFFLWEHLTNRINKTQPASLEDLRQRIVDD